MEGWRDIPGYEGRYQASSEGRIRSLDRIAERVYSRTGTRYEARIKGGLKKLTLDANGYYVVNLGHNDVHYVHELVADTFRRGTGKEIRHLDGNPLNNRAENLMRGTHSENEKDKVRYGGKMKKLTKENVHEIRELLRLGEPVKNIAKRFNVTETNIGYIKRGAIFAWLE